MKTDLSEGDIRDIRFRAARGDSRRDIARDYHKSTETISRILRGDTFAWVSDDPDMPSAPLNYSAAMMARYRQELEEKEKNAADESWNILQQKLAAKEAKGGS